MTENKTTDTFITFLSGTERTVYDPIIGHLLALGYRPQKLKVQGYVISFQHPAHKKQIAKMGVRGKNPIAFFSLRFSACRKYSKKFSDVVGRMAESSGSHLPMCDKCRLCKGDVHVYTHINTNGEKIVKCGAYTYDIPDITLDDVDEIKRLINEQHAYFMEYVV